MRFINPIIFVAIFGFSACQSDDKAAVSSASDDMADITLRATSDIQTPSPIKAASFVPNSVASWLGHIILLDEKGTLHRATTDSAETDVVALGKYADVIGLARDKKSGVFLALTPQGQIKAFVQTDDEGNFGPMAVSMGNNVIEQFCASTTPNQDIIWVKTTAGTPLKLSIETFEDSSVTLNEAEAAKDEFNPCSANNVLSLNEDYTIKSDSASNGLSLTSDTKTMTVDIANGLSIGQVKNAGFVTVTNTNMGSVYNEGVLLIAEKDEGRVVLISRAYALKEISGR